MFKERFTEAPSELRAPISPQLNIVLCLQHFSGSVVFTKYMRVELEVCDRISPGGNQL